MSAHDPAVRLPAPLDAWQESEGLPDRHPTGSSSPQPWRRGSTEIDSGAGQANDPACFYGYVLWAGIVVSGLCLGAAGAGFLLRRIR